MHKTQGHQIHIIQRMKDHSILFIFILFRIIQSCYNILIQCKVIYSIWLWFLLKSSNFDFNNTFLILHMRLMQLIELFHRI